MTLTQRDATRFRRRSRFPQIERLLATGDVKPEEIREIQAQLDTIRASDQGTPRPPFAVGRSTPEIQPRLPAGPGRPTPLGESYPNVPLVNIASDPYAVTRGETPPQHGFQPGHARNGSTPTTSSHSVPPPKMDFGNLLRDLTFAGVIGSSTSTPVQTTPVLQRAHVREGSVASVASLAGRNDGSEIGDSPDEPDGLKEYEEMVLSMNVGLTLSDLNK